MAAKQQNAIDLLKADHREVEGLFEKFEKARSAKDKEALAETICMELTVHTVIEEEIFYPACAGKIEEDVLNEAYVEHDGAKVLIAELETGGVKDDDFFSAKVTVLSEMIKHHVKEEEQPGGMFAQARKADIDLAELGARLLARKQELMAEIKKSGLPKPRTRSFVGHDLLPGEPVSRAA